MTASDTSAIRRSLVRQNQVLDGSIILTPVDSFPIYETSRFEVDQLEGLYATDNPRSMDERLASKIFFSGRQRLSSDIQSIYSMWSKALGAAETSMRLLSGLHAHTTVFMGIGSIGETVYLLPEQAGGHFATAGILNRLGYHVVDLPVDMKHHRVDMNQAQALIERSGPGILFIDRSEGLVYEDFSELTRNDTVYSVFDASQYLSGILVGRYQSPFSMGFDLFISTLHKSFPGPQKALVATRAPDSRWKRVKEAMSSYVSSHHVRSTYLAGLGLEDTERLHRYANRILDNAMALEDALEEAGAPVIRRQKDHPATHHLWLSFPGARRAFEAHRQLERCRIHTNYRLLPYGLGKGLRLGTTAATMRGLRPDFAQNLARLISEIIQDGFSLSRRHEVRALAIAMAQDNDLTP